jgi:hypothetical protein
MLVLNPSASLKTVGNGGHVQNSNGYDIVLATSGGSALSFEMVGHGGSATSYDPTTGNIELWGNVASISNGLVLNLVYGNSGISTYQGSDAATWNSGYQQVIHHGTATNLLITDSTSNGFTPTNNGTVTAGAGKIGGASVYNGSTQYLRTTASLINNNTDQFTISAWANTNTNSGSHDVFSQGNTGTPSFSIIFRTDNGDYNCYVNRSSGFVQATWNSGVTTSAWTRVDCSWDAATVAIYGNGAFHGSVSAGDRSQSGTDSAWGAQTQTGGAAVEFWSGSLDELRVQNTVRAAGWIATEYNNQSAPGTFYTVGSEQLCSGGVIGGKLRKILAWNPWKYILPGLFDVSVEASWLSSK